MSEFNEQPDTSPPLLTQEVADVKAAIVDVPLSRRLLFGIFRILGYALGVIVLLVVTFLLLGVPPGKALVGLWIGAVGDGGGRALVRGFGNAC